MTAQGRDQGRAQRDPYPREPWHSTNFPICVLTEPGRASLIVANDFAVSKILWIN
jgi:hypothetical protein